VENLGLENTLIEILDHAVAFARVCVGLASDSLNELDSGVTGPQFQVLIVLGMYGPHSVIALSRRLDLAPPATSRMLDRLSRQGLVIRTPSARSGREVDVSLTDRGKECIQRVMARRRAQLESVVRQIPSDHWDSLRTSLRLLCEASGQPTDLRYAVD
jgi:DNA-binding MarR family transcriptional regulator